MPPSSFYLVSALAALVLGILAGGFAVWSRSRYGETEKRYLIQGVAALACVGILLYVDLRHHIYWSVGIFIVVYFSTGRLIRSDSERKRRGTTRDR